MVEPHLKPESSVDVIGSKLPKIVKPSRPDTSQQFSLGDSSTNVDNIPNHDRQITLIVEFAMLQMDQLDRDHHRRVLLNVTSFHEELTHDGSGVRFSLSILMVSTTCEETSSLAEMDASNDCLQSLASDPQTCDCDCVRPFESDDLRLIGSQCAPVSSAPVALQRRFGIKLGVKLDPACIAELMSSTLPGGETMPTMPQTLPGGEKMPTVPDFG